MNNVQNSNSDLQSSGKILNCQIPSSPYTVLSQTCLGKVKNILSQGQKFDNLIEFEPQYPLYSDGATKRRWIYLPEGTQINTADPDNWFFPKGTILFKEFSIDGQIIETRQMEKIADGNGFQNWRPTAFSQLADNSDAVLTPSNINELSEAEMNIYSAGQFKDRYSVGTQNQCISCHSTASDSVRGFNYLQLSNPNKAFNLNNAISLGLLTNPPTKLDEIPGTALDKKVIGYIQSNCVTCHDGVGPGPGNFRHMSSVLSRDDENIMKRLQSRPGLIDPMQPPYFSLLYRLIVEGSMPKAPKKTVDTEIIVAIEDWIYQLRAELGNGPPVSFVTEFDTEFHIENSRPYVNPGDIVRFYWEVANATSATLKIREYSRLGEVIELSNTVEFAVITSGPQVYDYTVDSLVEYVIFELKAVDNSGNFVQRGYYLSQGPIRFIKKPDAIVWESNGAADASTMSVPAIITGGSASGTPVVLTDSTNRYQNGGPINRFMNTYLFSWYYDPIDSITFTMELHSTPSALGSGTPVDSATFVYIKGCPIPQLVRTNSQGIKECYTP